MKPEKHEMQKMFVFFPPSIPVITIQLQKSGPGHFPQQ